MIPATVATPPPSAAAAPGPRRVALVVLGVVAGLAGLLRVLDAVPAILRDEPRAVRRYATIEALERDTRTQLVLPFYFPDTFAWPPVEVSRAGGDGRPTRVTFADRATGAPRLVVAQCLDGDCDLAQRLLPPGRTVARTPATIGGNPGAVVRREVEGTGQVSDLEWRQFGRQLVVRMHGDDAELLRIGRSMRRGHP
jgi:hypothetical protein